MEQYQMALEGEEKLSTEKIFEEILAEHFPSFMKDINLRIQETH